MLALTACPASSRWRGSESWHRACPPGLTNASDFQETFQPRCVLQILLQILLQISELPGPAHEQGRQSEPVCRAGGTGHGDG